MVEFVKIKPLPLNFTVILLMFLKLTILLNLIMIYEDLFLILLILVSSQPYLNLQYADAAIGGVL